VANWHNVHVSETATAEEHRIEAARLLDDVWLVVHQSRHDWGSAAVTNMLTAARAHLQLAELKSRN
jgi:hypothetical protein